MIIHNYVQLYDYIFLYLIIYNYMKQTCLTQKHVELYIMVARAGLAWQAEKWAGTLGYVRKWTKL